METMDKPVTLPLEAIGALELGQAPEAVRIVRMQFGISSEDAQLLVDDYARRHPPASGGPAVDHGLPLWIPASVILTMVVLAIGLAVLP